MRQMSNSPNRFVASGHAGVVENDVNTLAVAEKWAGDAHDARMTLSF